jgi:hypothetical protein
MVSHKRNTPLPDSHPENPAKRPRVENNFNHDPLVDNQPQYTDIPLRGDRSYDNTSMFDLDPDLDSMLDDTEGLFTEAEQPIFLATEQQIGQETPGTQQTLNEDTDISIQPFAISNGGNYLVYRPRNKSISQQRLGITNNRLKKLSTPDSRIA